MFIKFVIVLLLFYVLIFCAKRYVGILGPQLEMNPHLPALEDSLNPWTTGKVPSAILGPGLVKAQNDARKPISVAARCPHGSSCREE